MFILVPFDKILFLLDFNSKIFYQAICKLNQMVYVFCCKYEKLKYLRIFFCYVYFLKQIKINFKTLGLEHIESLQNHENEDICKSSSKIINWFFSENVS